jgi:hypothetical protein
VSGDPFAARAGMDNILGRTMLGLGPAAVLAAHAPATAGAPTNRSAVWADKHNIPNDALKQDAAAWDAVTPRKYARTSWVHDFLGPSSATRIMTENGRAFAVGSVCKPHDCGDNIVAFVLEPGGAHAAGAVLLMDGDRKLAEEYFGNPTPLEHQWLRAKLWEGRN